MRPGSSHQDLILVFRPLALILPSDLWATNIVDRFEKNAIGLRYSVVGADEGEGSGKAEFEGFRAWLQTTRRLIGNPISFDAAEGTTRGGGGTMKAIFLRVGIDLGCGQRLSPQYSDGRFEYIPIPEGADKVYPCRAAVLGYPDTNWLWHARSRPLSARTTRSTMILSSRSLRMGAHHPKRLQILALEPGDWFAFYAGFTREIVARGTCFVIGYFVIAKIHDTEGDRAVWPPQDSRGCLEMHAFGGWGRTRDRS